MTAPLTPKWETPVMQWFETPEPCDLCGHPATHGCHGVRGLAVYSESYCATCYGSMFRAKTDIVEVPASPDPLKDAQRAPFVRGFEGVSPGSTPGSRR